MYARCTAYSMKVSTYKVQSTKYKAQRQNANPKSKISNYLKSKIIQNLLAFKDWLPFLKKRADTLILVFRRETESKEIHFAAQTFIES